MGSTCELPEIETVRPSGFACWARKLSAATPWPPGTLEATTVGCPGRCLEKNFARRRPVRSVLPAGVVGMIIVTVLPWNETVSACARGRREQAAQAIAAIAASREIFI